MKWTIPTPGRSKYEASPLAGDGKIYLINFDGDVVIVDAAGGEVLNQIAMGDAEDAPVRSTVVAAQGHLFVRTNRTLFCVGQN